MGSPDVIGFSHGEPDDVVHAEDLDDDDGKGYAARILDATGGDEDEEDDDNIEQEDDEVGASRVDAIINKVTDQLAEAAVADDVLDAEDEAAQQFQGPSSGGSRPPGKKPRQGAMVNKRPARNPARGADIAKILSAPRKPPEVRAYLAQKGFGRVPIFLRDVSEELDEEERYIVSLREPREPPRVFVRLLTQGEKDHLVKGLKQRFQQATAKYLKAPPKSRSKADLEAECEKIAQDIQNLGRPYIFVEDEDAH